MESRGDNTLDRIGGYRILRRLATGGTSDVLLARAEGPHGFGRTVVLKKLLAQYQNDPQFERMFAREAAAYARLSHPSIVKLYDFFSLEGQLVMVIEFIDGLPLNKLRAMLRGIGHSLDDRAAIYVASRVFAALSAAHSARDVETSEFAPVIHRDVNPSNVLVPWDGHVKLADFGIAKVAGVSSETQVGLIKGTYGYMAPEQVRGDALTVRADVYAGALMLWELLARRKAIQRGALPEMEVLRAMAEPHIVSLDVLRPDIDPKVRDAVRRGLEPVADRRSITADEMLSVLKASVKSDQGRQALINAMALVRPSPVSDVEATTESNPGVALGATLAEATIDSRSPVRRPIDDVEALARAVVALSPGPTPGPAPAPLPPRPGSSHAIPAPPSSPALPSDPQRFGSPVMRRTVPPQTLPSNNARAPAAPAVATTRSASTMRMERAPVRPPATPAPPPAGRYPKTLSGSLPDLQPLPPTAPTSLLPTSSSTVGPTNNEVTESEVPAWPLARSGLPASDASLPPQAAPPPPAALPFFPEETASIPVAAGSVVPPTISTYPTLVPSDDGKPPSGQTDSIEPLAWRGSEPAAPTGTLQRRSEAHSLAPLQALSGPELPQGDLRTPEPPGRSRGLLILALLMLVACGGVVGGLAWKRVSANARTSPSVAARAIPLAAGRPSPSTPLAVGARGVTTSAAAPGAPSAADPTSAAPSASAASDASVVPSAMASGGAAPTPPASSSPTPAQSAAALASGSAKGSPVSPPAAPVVAAATAPGITAAPVAAVAVTATGAPSGTDSGDLKTDAAHGGHRIFVDGHVVGQTPETVRVRCGPHVVRLGSSGKDQPVDVPCGGEVSIK